MNEKSTICTFYVDKLLFGVDVSEVQEVLRSQQITKVPLAPDVIQGLMNLRGQIVTALEMRKLLQLPPRASGKKPMSVLIRSNGMLVSLLVDAIGDVIDVNESQFERTPESIPKCILKLIKGVYKLEQKLLLALDTGMLFRPQEKRVMETAEV